MPLSDTALWAVIRDHPLPFRTVRDDGANPPRTCASFADCLRLKGDWTDKSAARITAIYREFLYLKALSGQPVTPSTCIDEAWHLHLEFKDDYAALCRATGRDIPHLADLSYAEQQRAYDFGHTLYEAEFDAAPARDLWPSGQDLANAEKLLLMSIGGVLTMVFLSVMGLFTGTWLLAVPVLAILALLVHFDKKWDGTIPAQMSRCG